MKQKPSTPSCGASEEEERDACAQRRQGPAMCCSLPGCVHAQGWKEHGIHVLKHTPGPRPAPAMHTVTHHAPPHPPSNTLCRHPGCAGAGSPPPSGAARAAGTAASTRRRSSAPAGEGTHAAQVQPARIHLGFLLPHFCPRACQGAGRCHTVYVFWVGCHTEHGCRGGEAAAACLSRERGHAAYPVAAVVRPVVQAA